MWQTGHWSSGSPSEPPNFVFSFGGPPFFGPVFFLTLFALLKNGPLTISACGCHKLRLLGLQGVVGSWIPMFGLTVGIFATLRMAAAVDGVGGAGSLIIPGSGGVSSRSIGSSSLSPSSF